jgi:hypothetical protein
VQGCAQNQLYVSTWSTVFVEHATSVECPVAAGIGAGQLLLALVANNARVTRASISEEALFAFESALLLKVWPARRQPLSC